MYNIQLDCQNDKAFEAIDKGLTSIPPLSHTIRSIRICHNKIKKLICPPNLIDLRACCNDLQNVILNVGIKTATLDKNHLTHLRIPSSMESISINDNLFTHIEPPPDTFVSAKRNPWIKIGTKNHRTLVELCIDKCILNGIYIPPYITNNSKKCINCDNATHNVIYDKLIVENRITTYTTIKYTCDICVKQRSVNIYRD